MGILLYSLVMYSLCVKWRTWRVIENCAFLGCYTVSNGNFLQAFRDNVAVQSSRVENPKKKKLKTFIAYSSVVHICA
jgi:hypothetical protein